MKIEELLAIKPLPPQPKREIRLGIVGLRHMATQIHLPAIRWLRDFGWPVNVSSITDLDPDLLSQAGEQWPEAARFSSFDEMAREKAYDAVVVITKAPISAALTEQALRHGLHVLVEKPVTGDVEHLRHLDSLALASGLVAEVGYNRIHQAPLPLFLQEVKRLGPPRRLVVRLWRRGRPEQGFFPDVTPHLLSVIAATFGDITIEKAFVRNVPEHPELPTVLTASACLEGGMWIDFDVDPKAGVNLETLEALCPKAKLKLSYLMINRNSEAAKVVLGEHGTEKVLFEYHLDPAKDNPLSDPATLLVQGFVSQMANFCARIGDSKIKPACSLKMAANISATYAAIEEQLEK